jgi:hypothetical protein
MCGHVPLCVLQLLKAEAEVESDVMDMMQSMRLKPNMETYIAKSEISPLASHLSSPI